MLISPRKRQRRLEMLLGERFAAPVVFTPHRSGDSFF